MRSSQAMAAWAERHARPEGSRMPSDEKFRGLIRAGGGGADVAAGGLLEHFRRRTSPLFFAAFASREETLGELRRRWPGAEEVAVEDARQICRGRFDLLGFEGLSFGDPIDWHLEPIAGKRAPRQHWSRIEYLNPEVAGDKKITWELNRHQYFATLGRAYWCTGDERYAETFVAHLTGWMDENPPKLGINWASSLEVALRAVSWLWALHFFRGSTRLTPGVFLRALKFLYLHARHLETYLSTYFSPNTHLTGEALGLYYLGTLLPEFRRASVWRVAGRRILLASLDRHVRPDGVYFEQASYYHRYTTDFYTHLHLLGAANGQASEARLGERLTALLDHLMHLTRPDGTTPLVGDDDGGRLVKLDARAPNDFRAALATGAVLFGRADYKYMAGELAEETLWLLGPEGVRQFDRLAARPPASRSRAFADGGYYLMRDGWGQTDNYLLVDGGPHGALGGGHAHADALAFEFAAGGTNWLIDPGTFTYTADARGRDEFRVTRAHNTATVDGESQSTPAGPFSWSRTARTTVTEFIAVEGFDYFEGAHDGYERLADPVTHARAVLFVKADAVLGLPAFLVVRDRFYAHACHHYALRYHLTPRCRAAAAGDEYRAAAPGGGLIIRASGPEGVRAQITEGWVSRCYGHREQAPVVVVEAEAEGAPEFFTCIVPTGEGGDARVEPFGPREPGAFRVGIRSGAVLDVVLAGDGRDCVECPRLAAWGGLAWGRFINGRLARAGLVKGHALEAADGFTFRAPAEIRYCAVEREDGRVVVEVRGARRFHLALPEPVDVVVINGEEVALCQDQRCAAFAEGAFGRPGWGLVEIDC